MLYTEFHYWQSVYSTIDTPNGVSNIQAYHIRFSNTDTTSTHKLACAVLLSQTSSSSMEDNMKTKINTIIVETVGRGRSLLLLFLS